LKNKSGSMKGCRILIVDDHRNIRISVKMILEGEGAQVSEAETVSSARAHIGPALKDSNHMPYDLLLLDIRLPDGSGLDLLSDIQAAGIAHRVIVISGEGTTQEAFRATQMGAFDFVEKPFTPEKILVTAKRCLEFNQMELTNKDLSKQARSRELIGEHTKIKEVLALVEKVAPTNGRVLITGESGTGKELIARAVHRLSPRHKETMIKVNCAAIPKNLMESELFGHEKGAFTGAIKTRQGVFERADGGTLFLDEIGELDLDVQAKLLRVLQNGEFMRVGGEKTLTSDVRIICATNRDLKQMSSEGEFREDLYYRLNVVTIHSPPLRERASDIPELSRAFLEECCEEHSLGKKQFSDRAIDQLKGYSWPGNVRELRNVIERTAILSTDELIDSIDNLIDATTGDPRPNSVESVGGTDVALHLEIKPSSWEQFHDLTGREYLKFILRQTHGNVSEAARILELERAYLHRLMKKLGIQRDVNIS
jgi:two-component system nitrogen regulation response regulator NtrX